MGGAISLTRALRHPAQFHGYVISAPAIIKGDDIPDWIITVGKVPCACACLHANMRVVYVHMYECSCVYCVLWFVCVRGHCACIVTDERICADASLGVADHGAEGGAGGGPHQHPRAAAAQSRRPPLLSRQGTHTRTHVHIQMHTNASHC